MFIVNAEKYEDVNSSFSATVLSFICASQGHADVTSDTFRNKHAATEGVKTQHNIFLIATNSRGEKQNGIITGQKIKSNSIGVGPKC